jgi:hypothetical protein
VSFDVPLLNTGARLVAVLACSGLALCRLSVKLEICASDCTPPYQIIGLQVTSPGVFLVRCSSYYLLYLRSAKLGSIAEGVGFKS